MNENEEIFLTQVQKIEIFELFFSKALKNYIIEATLENGYKLSHKKLNKFLGILIASIVNVRKKERDF